MTKYKRFKDWASMANWILNNKDKYWYVQVCTPGIFAIEYKKK